jgi:hypothetical protein
MGWDIIYRWYIVKSRMVGGWILGAALLLFALPGEKALPRQEDCSQMAYQVMELAQNACNGLKRDHICYGNVSIDASPIAGVSDFQFSQQGDMASLQDVDTLRLRSLDIASADWGVALMKVKASLPDDSSENVNVVLFGNIDVQNEGDDLANLSFSTIYESDVYLQPSADGVVVGFLAEGDVVTGNGRLTDSYGNGWIRIQFSPAPGGLAWVWADVLSSNADVSNLTEVQDTADQVYGPMQAFTFISGEGDNPCQQAPESGIVIQTPKGKGQISLLINEVNVQIGSTAYFQAIPGDEMRVSTLEGHLIVSSDGETRLLPPGAMLSVPLDEYGYAEGVPSEPEPYDSESLGLLNMALDAGFLDRVVSVRPALSLAYLADFNAYFNQIGSDFFNGDGNDYLFQDFFTRYFEGDLPMGTGAGGFGEDISTALIGYLMSGAVPPEAIDSFAQTAFNQLDADSQTLFLDTLAEQTDSGTGLDQSVQDTFDAGVDADADDDDPDAEATDSP